MIGVFELLYFFDGLAVVAETVVAVGGVLILVQSERRGGKGIDHERDDVGGVGLECKLGHREHQLEFLEKELLVLNVLGGRVRSRGLGFQFPLASGVESLFYFTHGGEVLIKPLFVIRAEAATELFRIVEQGVEDTAALFEAVELLLHRRGIALDKHFPKQCGRAVLSGQENAVACPGEATVRFVDVHAEVQCGKTGVLPKVFGGKLIK